MNENHVKLIEFHRAMGQPIIDAPILLLADRQKLRVKLIFSEAIELAEAMGVDIQVGGVCLTGREQDAFEYFATDVPNFVQVVDALCDLRYVEVGTELEMGVDIDPSFDEVHRSNMEKRLGPKDADGKQLKPPGWKPPDIAKVLRNQYPRKAALFRG